MALDVPEHGPIDRSNRKDPPSYETILLKINSESSQKIQIVEDVQPSEDKKTSEGKKPSEGKRYSEGKRNSERKKGSESHVSSRRQATANQRKPSPRRSAPGRKDTTERKRTTRSYGRKKVSDRSETKPSLGSAAAALGQRISGLFRGLPRKKHEETPEYTPRRPHPTDPVFDRIRDAGVRNILIATIVMFAILIGAELWSESHAKITFEIQNEGAVEVEYGSEFDVSNVIATYREPLHPSRTQQVECTYDGNLNTSQLGDYEITVEASYKKTKAEVTESVTVVDRTAPEITFQGNDTESVMAGYVFRDPGYSATDLLDGDVTDQVEISGNVDLMTPGTYERIYTVTDAHGNTGSKTRTIVVTENDGSGISEEMEANTIYLTFDDGPWKYTEKLLDILDQYNAKATFFVTNQYPDYIDLIAEEYKRGHTVAIHSYSHDYANIYSSADAFYADLEKMGDIIEEQTGEKAFLMRFPGGGSNTISRKYNNGIMTELTGGMADHGYLYADWNVMSGDAGDTTSTDKVVSNVISGIQNCSGAAIVLQHDIKDFSVDAVEEILKWGQENGYVFRAMTELSTMPHQTVNN